jgi:DNA-binding NarL/FixJ family response regulator
MQAELDKLTSCQKEVPVGNLEQGYTDYGSPWASSKVSILTTREGEIVTLLGRGLNNNDVCQVLDMKKNTLRQHLFRIRKKHFKK